MTADINFNHEQHEQQYEKPSTGAIIGGVIAGSTVNSLVTNASQHISPKIMDKMYQINEGLSKDEFTKLEEAAQQVIKTTGLADKGVSIIKATSENADEVSKIMSQEVNRGFLKHMPEKIKEMFGTSFSSQITSGKNACYTFVSKKIVMPENKLGLSVFHEAGHAMNANLSHVGKALQSCRALTLLMIPISLIALFKTKKAPGEEPKNKVDKATTFIKENAGKLTFATFLPVLIEEAMATVKGNKVAKELLSPELAKKVAKTNALGYSTYLLLATASGVGIYLGTKLKDSIAKSKPVENNQN